MMMDGISLEDNLHRLSLSVAQNKLPNEILANVARRLPAKTLVIAVVVCRAWNSAMTSELYRSITTYSKQQFEMLILTLIETNPNKRLAQYVRELTMAGEGCSCRMEDLLKEFPDSIKRLDWCTVFPKDGYPVKIRINYCFLTLKDTLMNFLQGRLSKLILQIDDSQVAWIDAVSEIGSIEELSIEPTVELFAGDNTPGLTLSFFQLEQLHNRLSKLQYLCLLDLTFVGKLPEHIQRCNTVSDLKVQVKNGKGWGQYFARKYTRLCRLELRDETFIDLDHDYDMIAETMPLVESYQNLEKCRINNLSYEELEMLASIGAKLTYMSYDQNYWFSKPFFSFHPTITTVTIRYTSNCDTVEEVMEGLKACPLLQDLEWLCNPDELCVDWILEELHNLQRLRIKARHIRLKGNYNLAIHHQLTDLRLTGDRIENDVYPYLSQYSPRIRQLVCDYGEHIDNQVTIYYPNLSLRRLSVFSRDDCIFKVTQMNEEERRQEYKNRYCDERSKEHKVPGCAEWWHIPYCSYLAINATEARKIIDKLCAFDSNPSEANSRALKEVLTVPIISIVCQYLVAYDLNYVTISPEK
ncbi:hypothetical protein EC973_000937 [Apophysomyces ossiformis]|uniref:F-box domain-containing protein n=1 Tax=Apophysomyces ossiformis TaxID=679940 RepID=A0A8H7BQM7_9FUNG|nr:hypothetical protein EC973_000937 [Apophysomyces ossiformis]